MNGRLYDDKDGNFTCFANNGTSLVDYIIASTSLFSKVSHFSIAEFDLSDHLPVCCTLRFEIEPHSNNEPGENINLNTWVHYKWNPNQQASFLHQFRNLYNNFRTTLDHSELSDLETLSQFMQIYYNAASSMKRVTNIFKSKTKKHSSWWDNDCSKAKYLKNNSLRHFRQTNSSHALNNYLNKKKHYTYVCKCKKVNMQKRNRAKLVNARKSPKEFWSTLKSSSRNTNNIGKIKPSDWQSHFHQLLNPPPAEHDEGANDSLQQLRQDIDDSDLNKPIIESEVRKSIMRLNSNKTPGPDGLCIELFKYTLEYVLEYLTSLFNNIFTSGIVPESWGYSIVCPILKKGSTADPNNFRGVSLINSMCKIFTGILTNRLNEWTEKYNVIHESQAGFRSKYSTIDNVFTLQSLVQKHISKKKGRFYCIYIDYKKAFDSVNHARLWDALERKGITGNFLNFWKFLYSKLKSCVKLNGGLTEYFDCCIGTRQGCIGSPKIFSLFINDLVLFLESKCNYGIFVTNEIPDVLTLMFADDVACFSDTVVRLQKLIDLIAEFCKMVGMELNLDKTKIVVFRNGGPLRFAEKWFYKGTPIEVVSFYKYLGVYFTPKLVWTKTQAMQAMQGVKAVARIFKYQKTFGRFSPQDIFKLFDTVVKPILCYGAEIWGYNYCDKIEQVHSRFCKQYCNLSYNAADVFALGECGRVPIAITYMTRCLKYWIRLLHMERHRYPKQCYEMLKSLDSIGRVTWATHIKSLLFTYGFGYVWISQTVGRPETLIHLFQQRIKDSLMQNWYGKISEMSKAEHYKNFKTLLDVEKYLSIDLSYKYRRVLANFRCSAHELMIEKGRQFDIDRNFRNCPICLKRNVFVVEDEFHFMMVCPEYEPLRYELFPYDAYLNISLNTFYNLMKTVDETKIRNISKFLYKAFMARNAKIKE